LSIHAGLYTGANGVPLEPLPCYDWGTNRRFVVTNRPGAVVLPGPTYDEYAARGEGENRNKAFQCDLAMDRLSDHRFLANSFRLYLHAAAMNLLVRLRQFIAEPLPDLAPQAETISPTSQAGEIAPRLDVSGVPVEALVGAARQRHFRRRRQRDRLGERQPCTWRTLLIKVALERYRGRWDPKELAELTRQLREFADSVEVQRAARGRRESRKPRSSFH
jgi:hypothetical protein